MTNELTTNRSFPVISQSGHLAACFLLSAATLLGQAEKLAPDLAVFDPNEPIDVIIQLEAPPAARPGAPRPMRPAALGGVNLATYRSVRELGLINGLAARLPVAALASLAADPRVKYISPDRPVTAATQNAIPAINARAAQGTGFDGRGIGIAVIDSGINRHVDFLNESCQVVSSRIVYRQNFAPADGAMTRLHKVLGSGTDRPDLYGHGTHVAGILAGNGRCSQETLKTELLRGPGTTVPNPGRNRLVGVARNANLIDLRALNSNGVGTDSSVIQALDRAIVLKAQYNIRVINLSLGRPIRESYTLDPLCQAVERAWKAGIVVVVAAGNRGRMATVTNRAGRTYGIDGYGTIGSPANDPFVITVGATRDMDTPTRADDLMASYSSKGPSAIDRIVKPDLIAPGNRIYSSNRFSPELQLAAHCGVSSCTAGTFLEAAFPGNRSQVTSLANA